MQNSHAAPIPAGALALDRMGAERPVPLDREVGPFATLALDVADLLPDVRWPAQIELRAGRHVVRPRYEVTRGDRTRIAHVNVERADLAARSRYSRRCRPQLGRGFLLPFPVLDRAPLPHHRAADADGRDPEEPAAAARCVRPRAGANRASGFSAACRAITVWRSISTICPAPAQGHAELVYDFREGGQADGWMHALVRYEDRRSGHAAETSFGAHIFNTAMTYKDEPQSYSGPPPGLTTRLFLKLGDTRRRSFAVLIYPASAPWHRAVAHGAAAA